MFKPNQNVYRFGNHVIVNEYSMRSDSFSVSKQKDEIRIMVFGDSVVNGGNLTNQNDLATEIIKRKINQQGKYKKVELAKKQRKPIIVVQHLKSTEVNSNKFEAGYYQIKKNCTNLKIKCISLKPYFIKAIHNQLNPYRSNDEIHINAIGQRMLAEAILDNFEPPKIMN
jgi:hypothetical protein